MAEHTKLDAAREKLTGVADEVKGKYEKVTQGVERRARKANEELHHGADVARQRYEEAGERLRDTYDTTRDRAREWNRDLNDFVQDSPGRALLLAIAAGFVIGLLFRRRG